jgi:hypothetical protein
MGNAMVNTYPQQQTHAQQSGAVEGTTGQPGRRPCIYLLACILHTIPGKANYEDTVMMLKGHYRVHQLAAAYHSQL